MKTQWDHRPYAEAVVAARVIRREVDDLLRQLTLIEEQVAVTCAHPDLSAHPLVKELAKWTERRASEAREAAKHIVTWTWRM